MTNATKPSAVAKLKTKRVCDLSCEFLDARTAKKTDRLSSIPSVAKHIIRMVTVLNLLSPELYDVAFSSDVRLADAFILQFMHIPHMDIKL